MELTVLSSNTNPSLLSSSPTQFSLYCPNRVRFLQLDKRQRRRPRRSISFTARSSDSPTPDWSEDWQRLSHSIRIGSQRFWFKCADSLKKETGFDIQEANGKVRQLYSSAIVKLDEAEFTRFRTQLFPAFLEWNRWERWKVIILLIILLLSIKRKISIILFI